LLLDDPKRYGFSSKAIIYGSQSTRSQRGSAIPRGPGLLQCMGSSTYCLTAERRREGTWHRGA
jgi:hypothetical protein